LRRHLPLGPYPGYFLVLDSLRPGLP
jgi:hypothetical protein